MIMFRSSCTLGWMAAVICTACVAGSFALPSAPIPHYRIEIDAYVRDERALCEEAWKIALERFGPGTAEAVTMTGGVMEPGKCLAVVYQIGAPTQVVSAGIYVRRGER